MPKLILCRHQTIIKAKVSFAEWEVRHVACTAYRAHRPTAKQGLPVVMTGSVIHLLKCALSLGDAVCALGKEVQSVVQGRGLGRMFLRHLRRTHVILHVVDAATGQYKVTSPEFCESMLLHCWSSVIIASTYPTSCESSFFACVDLSIHILQKLEKLRVLTGMSHDIAWSNQRVYPFGPAEQAGIYCIGRTHATLQVTVCADDPAMDYWAVREELRMYNPEYCARPHVVALNKMDLQDAAQLQQEIACEVLTMARRIQVDSFAEDNDHHKSNCSVAVPD